MRIVYDTVRCVMCKISNLNDPLRKCHGVNMTMFETNSEKKDTSGNLTLFVFLGVHYVRDLI